METEKPTSVIEKLIVQSLPEALRGMPIGQTHRVAEEDSTVQNLKRHCSILSSEGYLFHVSTRTGDTLVTRLK